jgi:TonB family protein
VADKITDAKAKTRLDTLIVFGEEITQLDAKTPNWSNIRKAAAKLPPGVEQSLLLLALTRPERASERQPQELIEALYDALKATRAITDARRPLLLLNISARFKELDSVMANLVLAEAIKELNGCDAAMLAAIDWRQVITIGPLEAKFPLDVTGLRFGFAQAFRAAAPESLEAGIARAEEINHISLRTQALVEIASLLIASLPRQAHADELLVRVGEDGIRKSAIYTVLPAYPKEAQKNRRQGVVVMEVKYNSKGLVTAVTVIEAPAPSIEKAAIEAVRQWKFQPSKTLKGDPVSVRGKLTFYFVLDKK